MSRDIKLLHPELQEIIPKFQKECEKQGLKVKITDTLRNKQEQNNLYAQGRSKPGKVVTNVKYPDSNHNWGMAFDFCRNDGKGAYNDTDSWFAKVGKVGVKFGLEWGGSWKDFPDKPHLELTKYGTTKSLKRKYGTPEEFKNTWKKEVEKINKVEKKKEVRYMHQNIDFKYRDKTVKLDVINDNGTNYVKVRDIVKLLDKAIEYDNSTKLTTIEDYITTINVNIDGEDLLIEAIKDKNKNHVPIREFSNELGYDVDYDEVTKGISLKKKPTNNANSNGKYKSRKKLLFKRR